MYNFGKLNFFVWNETFDIWTNTYFTALLKLHWFSFLLTRPDLVIDSGIHLSLHQDCHHQVIFCKLNFKIKYPPPYGRQFCIYGKAQTDLINLAIDQFD